MNENLGNSVRLTMCLVVLCQAMVGVVGSRGAQPSGLFPFPRVDNAAQDLSFLEFRARLIRALEAGDKETLLVAVEANLRNGFVQSFNPGAGRPLYYNWRILQEVLRLGGSFTTTRGKEPGRREFCAPYTYTEYPDPPPISLNSPDGEVEAWVIIGTDVPVRAEPSPEAPIFARRSQELVQINGGGFTGPPPERRYWIGVVIGDRDGWVPADQIRNPQDYHACFAEIEGRWLLVELERDKVPRDITLPSQPSGQP